MQLRSTPKSLFSSVILTYRFLLYPVRPNCTSPVETLSFSCVSPSLLRLPGFFHHFIPITVGGCLPSVSTYLICKLLFHFAFTKENMDLSNSTELGSEWLLFWQYLAPLDQTSFSPGLIFSGRIMNGITLHALGKLLVTMRSKENIYPIFFAREVSSQYSPNPMQSINSFCISYSFPPYL